VNFSVHRRTTIEWRLKAGFEVWMSVS